DSAQLKAGSGTELNRGSVEETQRGMKVSPAPGRSGNVARVPPAGDRMNAREGPGRQAPPAARSASPPSVPRAVTNERAFNQGNAGQGGGRSTGSAGAGAPAGASRGSAPSAGASSGGARSSGGSTGGGRPH